MTTTEIGSLIASKREFIGISRNKLADSCGLSRTEIIRIEEGTRKQPSPKNLEAIAKALHANYTDLLKAAGYINKDVESSLEFDYPILKDSKLKEKVEMIIKILSVCKIDESDMNEIINFIKFKALY